MAKSTKRKGTPSKLELAPIVAARPKMPKRKLLRHRFPLLPEHQDLQALSARVAYHLARLGISARHPRLQGTYPRQLMRDITTGRFEVRPADVNALAGHLSIDPVELIRPLTENEFEAWRYYHLSAKHDDAVWTNVKGAWSRAGRTEKDLAAVLGITKGMASNILHGRRSSILSLEDAAAITAALQIPEGPIALLPPEARKQFDRSPNAVGIEAPQT